MARRGSVYFLTLAGGVILVAAVLGLSYRMLAFRRVVRQDAAGAQARVHAEMAVRYGLWYTTEQAGWRDVLDSGTWIGEVTLGEATYELEGVDAVDGDLSDDVSDEVVLTGRGTVGGVTRRVRVRAYNAPVEQLRFAVSGRSEVEISDNVRVVGDVTTNGRVDKSGWNSWVEGNAEAASFVYEERNITGSVVEYMAPREYPDSGSILNYYWSRATVLPYNYAIERVRLSPTSNPWGAANPDGLYAINCWGQRIIIRDSRIVGTLVLINARGDSYIGDGINWKPAREDYPALITNGSISFSVDRSLNEWWQSTDFSEPSEPGFGSRWDVYPGRIEGLVYSTGSVVMNEQTVLFGALICHGMADLQDDARVEYDEGLWESPPRQFRLGYLEPVPGTWGEAGP